MMVDKELDVHKTVKTNFVSKVNKVVNLKFLQQVREIIFILTKAEAQRLKVNSFTSI